MFSGGGERTAVAAAGNLFLARKRLWLVGHRTREARSARLRGDGSKRNEMKRWGFVRAAPFFTQATDRRGRCSDVKEECTEKYEEVREASAFPAQRQFRSVLGLGLTC